MHQAVIVGGSRGIGQNLARLALPDYATLILVDQERAGLWQVREETSPTHRSRVCLMEEDLTQPDAAAAITDTILMMGLILSETEAPDIVINVLDFQGIAAHTDQLWDPGALSPHKILQNTLQFTRRLGYAMRRRGKGSILNLLLLPDQPDEWLGEICQTTRDLLLETGETMMQAQIKVHTLCYSSTSLILQTPALPEGLDPGLDLTTCSIQDLAFIGYRMLR
ncbi:MAG: hypothetical protein SF053_00435 [Bacteroidia bacterium]|nr:hypothetical protein [Bacteroidia bacterium]